METNALSITRIAGIAAAGLSLLALAGCHTADQTAVDPASAGGSTAVVAAAPAVSPEIQAQIDRYREAEARSRATIKPRAVDSPARPGH